jgi:hypothetical protein
MRSVFWAVVITINSIVSLALILFVSSLQMNQETIHAAANVISGMNSWRTN